MEKTKYSERHFKASPVHCVLKAGLQLLGAPLELGSVLRLRLIRLQAARTSGRGHTGFKVSCSVEVFAMVQALTATDVCMLQPYQQVCSQA